MKKTDDADRAVRRLAPLSLLTTPSARAALTALSIISISVVLPACHRDNRQDGPLILSGNIEVVDAQLSFKIAGRVAERPVFEGDHVKKGQTIAKLDAIDQIQQLALRRAELAAAKAALAEVEAGARPQEIASAEAAVSSAKTERDRADVDLKRQQSLLHDTVISARDFDLADSALKVADAHLIDAQERLKLLQAGARPETIEQAKARVQQSEATLALAQTQFDYTHLVSPMDGVVLSHNVEPGEFVSAGTPIVTVADTLHVWVRVYIDQASLGRIQHGQRVDVHTDTFPNKTYHGVIGFISSEAEFTPKTVQTTKERVKLVFRLKVDLENPDDELKPGMAADVTIPPVTKS